MQISIKALAVSVLIQLGGMSAHAQSIDDAIGELKDMTKTQPHAQLAPGSTLGKVTKADANGGLKLALRKAAGVVIGQLGAPGGFANDPKVAIGLPGPLASLGGGGGGTLGAVMGVLDSTGLTKGITGKLNAAAEQDEVKKLVGLELFKRSGKPFKPKTTSRLNLACRGIENESV